MVDILLAAYCSERFLAEQIESILAQDDPEWRLLIRDGGSDDSTLQIIQDYVKRDPRIVFLGSEKAGAVQNFSALLKASSAGYVMFSDHDDWWYPDKISKSLKLMRELESEYSSGVPLLVHTESMVADENLKSLGRTFSERQDLDPAENTPNRLLLQNTAAGNTMLLNRALCELASPIPDDAVMHDHWCMLTASVFGKIRWTSEPTLLYRQHGDNIFGAPEVALGYYFRQFRKGRRALRERFYANIRQGRAFFERFREKLPPEYFDMFHDVAGFGSCSFFRKCAIIRRYGIMKHGILRNIGIFFVL